MLDYCYISALSVCGLLQCCVQQLTHALRIPDKWWAKGINFTIYFFCFVREDFDATKSPIENKKSFVVFIAFSQDDLELNFVITNVLNIVFLWSFFFIDHFKLDVKVVIFWGSSIILVIFSETCSFWWCFLFKPWVLFLLLDSSSRTMLRLLNYEKLPPLRLVLLFEVWNDFKKLLAFLIMVEIQLSAIQSVSLNILTQNHYL